MPFQIFARPDAAPASMPGAGPSLAQTEAQQHWQRGLAHAQAGRWKEAERAYARAVRSDARDPLYWVNLAQARRKLGDLEGSGDAARRALSIDPRNDIAFQMAHTALTEQHRYAEAAEVCRHAADHGIATHATWAALGDSLYHTGQLKEAVGALMRAATLKPDYFPTYSTLSNVFQLLGMHREAAESLRTVVALLPQWIEAHAGVIYHSLYICDWSQLEADLAAVEAASRHADSRPVNPFLMMAIGADAARQLEAGRSFTEKLHGGITPLAEVPRERRHADGRIRIGYLSNDFFHHATAMLMAEVLELHDPTRFSVHLYSYAHDDGSEMRRRLIDSAEHFVDVGSLSDREAAERIRADGIDLLIDLKGYTMKARMGVMAYRAAPVQAQFLGFPGSTGAPFIDYVITDPVVSPPEMAALFSEKFAYLPDSYQPNDRKRAIGPRPSRSACGLPEDGIVFCCFNATYKIWPQTFGVWCRLLDAVPGSVLWLMKSTPQAAANLRAEAQAHGIDPQRLVFAEQVHSTEHLGRLQIADLFLDTLPVNAHTTASDALWAGVPVLTCVGDTFAGRVAASLLQAAGLPDLVTTDTESYERRALELARDPAALAEVRARVARARECSALYDSTRYTRNLEALFARMIARWHAGGAPALLAPEASRT